MRLYVRTSRNTGVSLGPVALCIVGPVIAAGWVLYGVCWVLYGAGWLVVTGIEAIGDWAERRQQQRRG